MIISTILISQNQESTTEQRTTQKIDNNNPYIHLFNQIHNQIAIDNMYEEIDDPLDRLLRQSNDNQYDDLDEDVDEMWSRELLDLQDQIDQAEIDQAKKFRIRTIKVRRMEKKNKIQLEKQMPGAAAHTLPAFITDSNLWSSHLLEKKRRHRLLNVKSSFDQFPAMRKHLYTQFKGSKKLKMGAKEATLKTKEWENERLRKQLKKAAKKVLKCTEPLYLQKQNRTKWEIEMSRTTMATKCLLNKIVPSNDQDSNQQSHYNGTDFGIDAGLDDVVEGNLDGSPTKDMMKFLREKADFHKAEMERYSGGR